MSSKNKHINRNIQIHKLNILLDYRIISATPNNKYITWFDIKGMAHNILFVHEICISEILMFKINNPRFFEYNNETGQYNELTKMKKIFTRCIRSIGKILKNLDECLFLDKFDDELLTKTEVIIKYEIAPMFYKCYFIDKIRINII